MLKRVLLVEDDPAACLMLRRWIERIDPDSRVIAVDNAEEALSVLENDELDGYPFSVVVADIGLPRSNGVDLWRVCARRHPSLRFVFVTGLDFEQLAEKFAGELRRIPRLLEKPVSYETLAKLWATLR